jgi:hypothetical protein
MAGAHRSAARRCSRARDLAAMAWEARGGSRDLYPGWHETAEGLGRPGNGGRSSSMRGCSSCGDEERRGAAGAVWRGRDGVLFYRGGEAVVGWGDSRPSGGHRSAITAPDTRRGDDGAASIHGEIEEELVTRRFSSIRVWEGIQRRR